MNSRSVAVKSGRLGEKLNRGLRLNNRRQSLVKFELAPLLKDGVFQFDRIIVTSNPTEKLRGGIDGV